MMPKILLVGPSYKGTLSESYGRAFESLEVKVFNWDPATAFSKSSRGGRISNVIGQFIQIEPWIMKANLEFLALASDLCPEIILVIATKGVHAGTLAQIKTILPDSVIYSLFPDTPHNLTAQYIDCLPLFDRVITYAPELNRVFQLLGARTVSNLPFGADTVLHQPRKQNVYLRDIAFIGNWRAERESFLEQLSDFDLGIWGSDYWLTRTRRGSPLRKLWAGSVAIGSEFSNICGTTRILLNILGPISWPGPNMRSFELPACGAFVLSERQPGILRVFTEGEHITCFDSVSEAREQISYYLQNETERLRIAENGYSLIVNGGHTYQDRAKTILQWFNLDVSIST